MNYDLLCLNFTGQALSEEIRKILVEEACDMIYRKEKQRNFSSPDQVTGKITTELKSALIGTFAGTFFQASIDHGSNTTIIQFLVPTKVQELYDLTERTLESIAETHDTLYY